MAYSGFFPLLDVIMVISTVMEKYVLFVSKFINKTFHSTPVVFKNLS